MSRLLVEPPGAGVPARRPLERARHLSSSHLRTPPERLGALRIAAAAAALVLVLASSGDAVLLAVVIGVAAADRLAFVSAALVAVATVGRWGSFSLAGVAGNQAVLGWAGGTGAELAVASSWLSAGALVATAAGRSPVVVAPLGLLAGLVVAGPAASSPADAAVRVAGAAGGLLLAAAAARWLPRRPSAAAALVLGAAGAATGLAS